MSQPPPSLRRRRPRRGGLHLITRAEVDPLGRATKVTDPADKVTYVVYKDDKYEARVYPGWDTSTNRPTGPTRVLREDRGRKYAEALTMAAAPSLDGGNRPNGNEAISGVQTLARRYVNNAGQVTDRDAYFNVTSLTYDATAVPLGVENTHYYRTRYAYDAPRGWLTRVQSPTGTIYRTVHDALGRPVSAWVGLDDTPTSGAWSPTNTANTDLVKVGENVYDGGLVGDGLLTQSTAYPGLGAPARVGQYHYDWRNRLVAAKAGVEASENTAVNRPIFYYTYDNLDQVTRVQRFDGDAVTLTSSGGVPQAPSASLLRARGDAYYDERGRVYRTETFSVDPSTGAVGSALWSKVFYDRRGHVLKTSQPGLLINKAPYDGAGRLTKTYTTDGGGDAGWEHAGDVLYDAVLTQTEVQYDKASNPSW